MNAAYYNDQETKRRPNKSVIRMLIGICSSNLKKDTKQHLLRSSVGWT